MCVLTAIVLPSSNSNRAHAAAAAASDISLRPSCCCCTPRTWPLSSPHQKNSGKFVRTKSICSRTKEFSPPPLLYHRVLVCLRVPLLTEPAEASGKSVTAGGRAGIDAGGGSVYADARGAGCGVGVPRGRAWTGPGRATTAQRAKGPTGVARNAWSNVSRGSRGVGRVRRWRAGADTRDAQLWTPGGYGTSARGAGAMGSFKYKWEDLQKLVLLTFNNTTAAVSNHAPPFRCHAPLPCRGDRALPGAPLP